MAMSFKIFIVVLPLTLLTSAVVAEDRVKLPKPPQAQPPRKSPESDDRETGQGLYIKRCRKCHGPEGHGGNARLEKMLGARPKDLRSEEVQRKSDADLTAIIRSGKGKMKPVKGLSATEIRQIVMHVRTFRGRSTAPLADSRRRSH